MLGNDTVFHCFFEQSGTFKKEFSNLGFKAYDYDILDQFGQTDFVCDLFDEIENAYVGRSKLFDSFVPGRDFIIAFFPCVRFSIQFNLMVRAEQMQLLKLDDCDRIDQSMKYEAERSYFYGVFCKLCYVCLKRGIRLVAENPYDTSHYLVRYFPIKAAYVDMDRRDTGDYFHKPTQYFFLNCIPSYNFCFESLPKPPLKRVANGCSVVERSMISPVYANRFIREFIL